MMFFSLGCVTLTVKAFLASLSPACQGGCLFLINQIVLTQTPLETGWKMKRRERGAKDERA